MSPTEYVELKHIDKLLQCGICYEYMDTSVLTSCSHSYCSLCIRKYLHYKTQCPTCFEETFEKDLRKNNLLDEIIIHYLNFKNKIEKKFYQKEILTVENENFDNVHSPNNLEYKKKQNVSDTNDILVKSFENPIPVASNTTHGRKNDQQNIFTPSTSTELTIPSMFTPKRKGVQNEKTYQNLVACPVCKVDVFQNNINKHLDDCLKREKTKVQPKKSELRRKPLPKLVLSLMKDNIIRKKLKEFGLSSQGDRKTLESRLQRYIILYNAECDKINPRAVSELIKQCEEEENLERKIQKPSNRLNINRNTEQNIIEQQRKNYLAANKDSYDELILKMKHPNSSRKLSVRRNILSQENSDVYKDCVTESTSTIRDDEKSNFLTLNFNTEDSNMSCANMNPTNFLAIELSSSSNDSNDQYASNHISNNPCKIEPVLSNFNIKTENNNELLFPESSIIHEETISSNQSREHNATESRMNIDDKESLSELKIERKNKRKTKLSVKRNRNNLKYSPTKRVAYPELKDEWQKEPHNEVINSNVEDYFIRDSDNSDIQDYEKLKDEQVYNVKEKCTSDRTKFEKENLDSSDENIKSYALRKREREMTFTLNVKENVDKSTDVRKLSRFGLSEARGFNNENFKDKTDKTVFKDKTDTKIAK